MTSSTSGPHPPWRKPLASRSLVDVLRAQGFDDESARSRSVLSGVVDGAFRRIVGDAPRWRWVVPGRVEVFGKHTDYAGGRSLVAAVPRGFVIAARERDDGLVRVSDARYGGETVVEARGDGGERRGWASYVAVVVRRLAANFPGASLGADIVVASDLPRAAGLSSSSALIVAVGSALVRRANLTTRDEWLRAIHSPLDLAAYFGCMENGSNFGALPGTSGVGTEGGSEDHTAIIASRAGFLGEFQFAPIRHCADVPMPGRWRFVIASSGVRADKAGTVRERYNRASRAAGALVRIWNAENRPQVVTLAAALASSPEAAARLEASLSRAGDASFAPDDLARRLRHFVNEDGRVSEATDAFRRADADALGRLARASQDDAEVLLGNQVAETSGLVRAALDCGAVAASSFGAGFGGSAWAVIDAAGAGDFGEAWTAGYRARHPHVQAVEWFSAFPAPSAIELLPTET